MTLHFWPAPAQTTWDPNVMLRINGNYLYRVGSRINPVATMERGITAHRVQYVLYSARNELENFLRYRTFNVRTCVERGREFLDNINKLLQKIESQQDKGQPVDEFELFIIKDSASTFENVLTSELETLDLYFVSPKANYSTYDLITNGLGCFPADAPQKVPEAVFDLSEACRCLAFEVPTACGFHLHRANEAVLRKYWTAVTRGSPLPRVPTMGAILGELKRRKKGAAKVKAVLVQIKDHHRNPVIHPEDSLDLNQAVALMGVVNASVTYMLEEIPKPPPAALPPPPAP